MSAAREQVAREFEGYAVDHAANGDELDQIYADGYTAAAAAVRADAAGAEVSAVLMLSEILSVYDNADLDFEDRLLAIGVVLQRARNERIVVLGGCPECGNTSHHAHGAATTKDTSR